MYHSDQGGQSLYTTTANHINQWRPTTMSSHYNHQPHQPMETNNDKFTLQPLTTSTNSDQQWWIHITMTTSQPMEPMHSQTSKFELFGNPDHILNRCSERWIFHEKYHHSISLQCLVIIKPVTFHHALAPLMFTMIRAVLALTHYKGQTWWF